MPPPHLLLLHQQPQLALMAGFVESLRGVGVGDEFMCCVYTVVVSLAVGIAIVTARYKPFRGKEVLLLASVPVVHLVATALVTSLALVVLGKYNGNNNNGLTVALHTVGASMLKAWPVWCAIPAAIACYLVLRYAFGAGSDACKDDHDRNKRIKSHFLPALVFLMVSAFAAMSMMRGVALRMWALGSALVGACLLISSAYFANIDKRKGVSKRQRLARKVNYAFAATWLALTCCVAFGFIVLMTPSS